MDRGLAAIVGADGATALATVADPRRPERLAALPSPRRAYDVALAAGLAHVAQGSLATWDLSDPRHPRLIGETSDGCAMTALTVAEQLVVGAGKRDNYTACLTVWDAADPGHPRAVGALNLPLHTDDDWVNDVTVAGPIAYVGLLYGGLVIVDLDGGSSPAAIGRWLDAGASVRSVLVAGGLAYVADGHRQLFVVNVRNPQGPVTAAVHELRDATALALEGDLLALTNGFTALEILSVAAGPQPALLGTYTADIGWVLDIATDESTRPAPSRAPVFAIGPTQVHAFDVTTPSKPLHLGTLNLPYRADGVATDGGRVYVGTRRDGLVIIDATDPANMGEVGRFVPDDSLRLPHMDYLPIVGLDAAETWPPSPSPGPSSWWMCRIRGRRDRYG